MDLIADWTPTPHLRFRREWVSDERTARILQQQWMRMVNHGFGIGTETEYEWRDVPLAEDA